MTGKTLRRAFGVIVVLALSAGAAILADGPRRVHFRGVINDYPVSTTSTGATIGPWEVRGPWSLDVHGFSGTADFSAALTMEFSDFSLNAANAGLDNRSQHTHNIIMTGATVIENPPQGTSPGDCPPNASGTPGYSSQIEISGMADVAGNGGSPFGAGVLVPLQVCIDGSTSVQFSNVTLMFTQLSDGAPSPATLHFGAQPLHGVVSTTN